MRGKYDRTGRQVRANERAMRRSKVPGIDRETVIWDYVIPICAGLVFGILVCRALWIVL